MTVRLKARLGGRKAVEYVARSVEVFLTVVEVGGVGFILTN